MVKMNWNQKWQFTKDSVAVSEGSSVLASGSWEELDLPHTWNGEDGQDGGNDYYRGTCYYVKSLKASEFPEGMRFTSSLRGKFFRRSLCERTGGGPP